VICAATERDNWMSAEEALKFGIIDKVMTNREKETEDSEKD
jgi:ATP-dependent Clp protease protease subunit